METLDFRLLSSDVISHLNRSQYRSELLHLLHFRKACHGGEDADHSKKQQEKEKHHVGRDGDQDGFPSREEIVLADRKDIKDEGPHADRKGTDAGAGEEGKSNAFCQCKEDGKGNWQRCRHESGGDALRAPLPAEKSGEVVGHGAVDKEGKPQKEKHGQKLDKKPRSF